MFGTYFPYGEIRNNFLADAVTWPIKAKHR
jgi:hypothetical protein